MEAIFEADFIGTSYGFRKGKECHQALAALSNVITMKPVSYVIDEDIKGFSIMSITDG
jgi:RNA-directed DNA polymerase